MRGGDNKTLAWAGNLETHLLVDTGVVRLPSMLALIAAERLALERRVRLVENTEGRQRALERLAVLAVTFLSAQATQKTCLSWFWVVFGLCFASAAARAEAGEAGSCEDGGETEKPPLQILFVHPSDELYGSDRVLLELVRRLDGHRFRPQVVVSTDVAYAGRLSRRLAEEGIPVHRLRIGVLRRQILTPTGLPRYVFDLVVSTLRLVRLMRRERIDLVHANTVTVFPAAFAARLAGVPLLWHIHEIVPDRPGRGLLHLLVRTLASRVVVVSEAARASLDPAARFPVIDIIPNGIDVPAGPPDPPPDPGCPIVAYVGRLSRRKGPDVLVRAMARLVPSHPKFRLVFAGDEFGGGNEIAWELAREADRLGLRGRVEFRPFREEVRDLLSEASLVVSPSVLPESFGLILLEAMAAGRPVVATDHGGPREVVVPGQTGLLVPPGDEEALSRAIETILDDPALALRMGKAAREHARRLFAVDRMVDRFERIYLISARKV